MSFAIWWSRNKAPFLWAVLIVAATGVIRSSIQDTFTPALAFLRVTLACVAVAMIVKLFFHYKRQQKQVTVKFSGKARAFRQTRLSFSPASQGNATLANGE